MENIEMQKTNRFYVFRITLVASVGGFLFGYDLSVISGALPFLIKYFHLSSAMQGFAVSSAILGAAVGPLFGLWFSEQLGRRKTMMVAAICFMISSLGAALAFSVWDFAFWRFVGGIGVGLAMMTSPTYIAELAPPHTRGSLVNVNQLSVVIGVNLSILAGYLFSFDGWGWRWMFGAEALPVAFLITGLFFIPESPRWLAAQNRIAEALKILTKVNGRNKAEDELKEIKKDLQNRTGSLKELLRPGIRLALFMAILLMIFSHITGVNTILAYAPVILADAGISSGANAILNSMPVYMFIFICTIFAFWFIKRFSRRRLLITSVLLMAAGHVIMAVNLRQHWPPLYTLVPMFIAAGAFTLGFAPLSWIIVTEILPTRIRGTGMAVVCSFSYLSSFVTAQAFPMLTHWFEARFNTSAGVYWIFCGICLLCALFSWRMIPETKGLSLEKISEFWQRDNQTRLGKKKHKPYVKENIQ